MTENQHIEFKQKVTPELEKEVVAFLNSKEGGVIYMGIDKNGVSIRVKDADQEQLDSGIPRILEAYPKESFRFSENFLRITLPSTVLALSTPQVTPQVEGLIKIFVGVHNRAELQEKFGLSDRKNFRINYLQPAVEAGLVALTIPDKPTSHLQKYYLTEKGKELTKL